MPTKPTPTSTPTSTPTATPTATPKPSNKATTKPAIASTKSGPQGPQPALRTMIVEDEALALERLERIATSHPALKVVATFTQSAQALAYAYSNPLDLVMLDIEMPQIDGLTLADMIFQNNPTVDIVFVTAYDKYAIEAFQANAVGYLLKPIEAGDLNRTLQKILARRQRQGLARAASEAVSEAASEAESSSASAPRSAIKSVVPRLRVQTLGDFVCRVVKGPSETLGLGQDAGYGQGQGIKWRTAKAEELLALLVHYRGRPISKDKLYDLLWPDMTADKASKNLHAVSYYLREALADSGLSDVIERDKGSYRLRTEGVSVDFYEIAAYSDRLSVLNQRSVQNQLSAQNQQAAQNQLSAQNQQAAQNQLSALNHLSALNLGPYFGAKDYPWAQEMATWLETQFERLDLLRCRLMAEAKDDYGLQLALEDLLQRNPLCEDAYGLLIQHHLARGQEASAKLWYQKYARRLREELGVEPSTQIRQLLE